VSAIPSKRILELDGLRAFAILPVMFHHCYPDTGWFGGLAFLGQAGWIGVDLFFVLSGYLITGILLRTRDQPHYYKNFVIRRTIRIFPLYYVCLALFLAGAWRSGGPLWDSMRQFGGGWYAFYLGNIRAAYLGAYPPVPAFVPLWSLQVEEQFYLLYPLVVLLLPRPSLRRFLLGCAVTAPLLRCLLALLAPDNTVARYVLMPCRMDALALGGLVAILALSPSDRWPSAAQLRGGLIIAGVAVLALYTYAWNSEHGNTSFHPAMSLVGYSMNALASAFLLAVVVLRPSNTFNALLRWRPLVYTGEIAYGLYLLHIPVSWVGRKLFMSVFGMDVDGHSMISVIITFIASFLVAGISWRFFETPILAWKDRLTIPTADRQTG